jgi:hypothetical protein
MSRIKKKKKNPTTVPIDFDLIKILAIYYIHYITSVGILCRIDDISFSYSYYG